jgi:RND family efflux transporter MFP subunit
MKIKTVFIAITFALLFSSCQAGSGRGTEEEEKVISVETMQITRGSISRALIYQGQVRASEQINVMPKMGGKVVSVNYDIGERVNSGAVLFDIDPSDISGTVSSAEAQHSAAVAGVQTARAGLNSVGAQTESQLLSFENTVNNAATAVENANLTLGTTQIAVNNAVMSLANVETAYNNAKALYNAGTISKTEFDRIELNYMQALSALEQANVQRAQATQALEQAESSYEQAKAQYDVFVSRTRASQLSQAQAGVSQASASAEASRVAIDNARRNLSDLSVSSPISGIVSVRNVSVGGMALPSVPAFTIIDIDEVKVDTQVSEELINTLRAGMRVPVYISSIGDEPFYGVISSVSPAADEIKNTYPVGVTVDNPGGNLKPGMFAEIHFIKELSENAVILPRSAVLSDEDGYYVFASVENRARKFAVETGIDNGKEIEIINGLPEGAHVIIKGHTFVTDGDALNVVRSG